MKVKYIKTNRAFTNLRKYGWLFTVLVAIGGLWEPRLGLFVIPIMLGLTITAFFKGRYWCGNICPHGSFFDVLMLPLSKNNKTPDFLRSKWMIGGFFVFFMFNFSRKILKVIASWGSLSFLEELGFVFSTTYLMVMVVGGLLAVLINPRTWCQFCPMATMQNLSYKLGNNLGITKKTEKKVTISDMDKCYKCGKCAKACPFQLSPYLNFSEKNQFEDERCIKCGICIDVCPAKILSFEYLKADSKLMENS